MEALHLFCSIFLVLFSLGNGLDKSHRLPDDIKPLNYNLKINTNLDQELFDGSVTIEIEVLKTTTSITLHSKDLDITSARLFKEDNEIAIEKDINTSLEFYIINLKNSELIANQLYNIKLEFNGKLITSKVGYYLGSYFDENNIEKKLAVTHFEPTNARRAFPCFDELRWKAEFEVTLCRNIDYISLFNTPLSKTIDGTNAKEKCDVYTKTPPMSTYLVAFAISDYKHITDGKFSVYARDSFIQDFKTLYAYKIGRKVIDAMESYTNIKYGLEKLDQIAIPDKDFKIGGMENWGLVTYKERYLLYNEELNTALDKQTAAKLICHELSHQWFGNLVTPFSHKYIWLNEGFATYLEFFICAPIEKNMDFVNQFITLVVHRALGSDGFEQTRPLTKDAETPSEISALYDDIAYHKGGCIVRMLEHILTNGVLQSGLRLYLKNGSLKNTEPADLYEALQTAINDHKQDLNISAIMSSWENESGYPVVSVRRDYENKEVQLTQNRFLYEKPVTEYKTLWYIPITYATQSEADFETTSTNLWFTKESIKWNAAVENDEWIIINKQQTGFYRVNYDEQNWKLIAEYLLKNEYNKIHVINRAQLIDDGFNLARGGQLNYSIPLQLVKYLKNEDEYIPIYAFTKAVNFLHPKLYVDKIVLPNFEKFVKSLLSEIYKTVGFDYKLNDFHKTKLIRSNILPLLCQMNFEDCNKNSLKYLNEWRINKTTIHPELQSIVYCYGLRNSFEENEINWKFLRDVYKNIIDEYQKTRLVNGLGCFKNNTYFEKSLNLAFWSDHLETKSDRLTLITSVYMNNEDAGINYTIKYIDMYFELIRNKLTDDEWSSIFLNLGNVISTNKQVKQLRSFQTYYKEELGVQLNTTLTAAIRAAEKNIKWMESRLPEFVDFRRADAGRIVEQSMLILVTYFIIHLLQ